MGALTVTLNHEWLDDIMSDHLKVGMADPVADGGLGASEEVVEDGNFMTQEHQAVDEVGSNETGPAGNQDTLALRRGQEFDRWETRESGVGDRVAVWVEDGFGLVRCETLGEPGVQFLLLCVLLGKISAAWSSHNIMRSKVKRSKEINGDFAIEAKTIETNGLDFLTRLIQDLDLGGDNNVSEKDSSDVKN